MAAVNARAGKGQAGGRLGMLCGGVPCLIPNSRGEIVTALQRPEKQNKKGKACRGSWTFPGEGRTP